MHSLLKLAVPILLIAAIAGAAVALSAHLRSSTHLTTGATDTASVRAVSSAHPFASTSKGADDADSASSRWAPLTTDGQ